MKRKRIRQVIKYGWKDAFEISKYPEVKKSSFFIFLDILRCFKKYYVFSNQYKTNKIWNLEDKENLCKTLGEANLKKDEWVDDYYDNRKFLNKYTSRCYENSPSLILKRQKAYTRRYNLGENCIIQYNVEFSREHQLNGTLKVGKNVIMAKNVFIDYSGFLTIGDDVIISNGVVIETHEHMSYTNPSASNERIKQTRMIIHQGVIIGSMAIIHASVKDIGRFSRIGAGAVVRYNVPPYAIVMGNPAKIVAFSMTPDQVAEFEREKYLEEERISIEQYEKVYNKFFIDRIDEINQFIKK